MTSLKKYLIESLAIIPHKWSNEGSPVFRVLAGKVPKSIEEMKLL